MLTRRSIGITVLIVVLLLVTPVIVLLVAPMSYHGLIAKLVRDISRLELSREELDVDVFLLEFRGKQLAAQPVHRGISSSAAVFNQL